MSNLSMEARIELETRDLKPNEVSKWILFHINNCSIKSHVKHLINFVNMILLILRHILSGLR